MRYAPINLKDKLGRFDELWSPKVVAEINDYQVKLVKVSGEFVWHKHDDTDELFLCLAGKLDIEFRDGRAALGEGELYVVPRGIEHKPSSEGECHVLIIEPKGVANTGDEEGALTAPNDQWV